MLEETFLTFPLVIKGTEMLAMFETCDMSNN